MNHRRPVSLPWIGGLPIEARPGHAQHATPGGWVRSFLSSLPYGPRGTVLGKELL